MRPRTSFGIKLPQKLLNELNIDNGSTGRSRGQRTGPAARKEHRKAARVQKKAQVFRRPPSTRAATGNRSVEVEEHEFSESSEELPDALTAGATQLSAKTHQSILKKAHSATSCALTEGTGSQNQRPNSVPRVSKAVEDQLAAEDAEIAALEKALGIKRKSKLPKAFEDDGLDNLLVGFDHSGNDVDQQSEKRKRDEEKEWLENKRRKTQKQSSVIGSGSAITQDNSDGSQSAEGALAWEDSDEFETVEGPKPVKVRENPYVAPPVSTKSVTSTKYTPPPLRAPATSETEDLVRLRRQLQGLLNRLSEANMISILNDVEKLYQSSPRHHVSQTLLDLLMGLLSDPTILQDTFVILHAGFIAGVYKVMGTDFGAQMVEKVIVEFDSVYQTRVNGEICGKKMTNLMSLIAEMYNFQVVGSKLIYDLIRLFLEDLGELSAELLLRIVRVSGSQLRQDDPSSLKGIVLLLQPAAARIGAENLSVRTKFMIETINNLKNNRMKTGVAASAMISEHTIRMKRTLGSLNTRYVKASEPLRISLEDIRDTEKRGKWWLVGASYRDKDLVQEKNYEKSSDIQNSEGSDRELPDESHDLLRLAREHRMNTDIRRSIFVTIMSASDYRDAHLRLLKLRLKKSQELEIPQVLMHCAGAESVYNPFYTLIAKLLCSDRKLKMAFQFSFWDLFKQMGEGTDDENSDGEEDRLGLRAIVNLAKMLGTLVAEGALSIGILKTLSFAYLKPRTRVFVELLFVTVILHSQQSAPKQRDEKTLTDVFMKALEFPELMKGLQYFIRKIMRKSDVASNKQDRATVKWGCRVIGAAMGSLSREITEG